MRFHVDQHMLHRAQILINRSRLIKIRAAATSTGHYAAFAAPQRGDCERLGGGER
jgi:hypothetical protein